ncbi:cytochrome P450 [Streptomyces kanamyceticus]|uniref:Cytochrome P450 n=1 Tax=Streptomyces kanamyceticus TaxID=1967 RepID=A0A5J6GLR7_STRKN|nr:cytochrome P450 [Streptomyces kanamyceticus]QEU96177.1 cytochrome P450 [Streptomyces kanamyceticus]
MTVRPAEVNLADPELYTDGDPYAAWRALRAHAPVSWQQVSGTLGFWSVTRYADVERVLEDHASFTSERGTLLSLLGRGDPAAGRQMAVTDPPRHNRMRAPLHRALRLRSAEAHAEEIRAGIRELLPDAPPGEAREFDFAAACAQLPLVVLGPLLGLPARDRPRLVRLAMMCAAEDDPEHQLPGGSEATLERGHRELFAYFADVVRQRRRGAHEDRAGRPCEGAGRPREGPGDLVDVLLSMEVDGARLTPGEVLSNCYSLLLGASVTLAHVPPAAVLELSRTGRYAEWAARPDLLDSGVEEALRRASPARHFMRHARRPVVLAGVPVAEGDPVVAWLGSANHDETVFPRPDVFDPGRRRNRHLAFGAGPHYCAGASIARVTLRLFFAELFARYAEIEVTGAPVRARSTFLSGITHLPVRVRPRQKEVAR